MKTELKGWFWNPSIFILEKDFEYQDKKISANYISTADKVLKIINGRWIIKAGFEWDGASWVSDGKIDPKTNLPITYYATLIHDIGYSHLETLNFPYNRRELDQILLKLLTQANFKYAKLYYYGSRILGGIYHEGRLIKTRIFKWFESLVKL